MNKYKLFLELQRYPALLEELSNYKLQKALHQCRMMIDEFEFEKFTRLEPLMSNEKKDDRRWTLHQRQARKNLSEPYDQKIKKLKYWENKIDAKLTTNSIDERLSRLDEKFKDSENGKDPRLKYHSENYFDTALEIYRNSKKDNQKGLTWPEVYEKIVAEENKLGMENRYSTFESFDTRRKKYQREQRSPN